MTELNRKTKETDIKCKIDIKGTGKSNINTGVGFFDHMLEALSKHSGIDMDLSCDGDLHIDAHHTVEDCGIVLGKALKNEIFPIEAVERYGKMSGRIFELLESNSYLDQQAIGEMSIIPARETRERLYCMYRDKWVDYVEICKRSDFNPASTYYFWYLDKKKLDKALHETLYMSIYKLRCRRVFERSENWSVAESSVQDIDIGNEEANRKRVKFEFALDRIDQGILQTDYTSMILSF